MNNATHSNCLDIGFNSPDCSFIISHLIRQSDETSDEKAFEILCSILDLNNDCKEPCLNANIIKNPDAELPFNHQIVKVACFTESTLRGLGAHAQVFNAKFGISFQRKFLLDKDANPCLFVSSKILHKKEDEDKQGRMLRIYEKIPIGLHPFIIKIELPCYIDKGYNSLHEREWRHVGNFKFKISDLVFVFAPRKYFKKICKIQKNGLPNLFDLDWIKRL